MKKTIRNIINAGLFLSFIHYFLLYRKFRQNNRNSLKSQKKLDSYYVVTMQWIYNLQHGYHIGSYLKTKNIQSVSIYGMGNLAEALINELSDTDIEVIRGIDQNAENYSGLGMKFPVIPPDKLDMAEEMSDAIIAYDDIVKALQKNGIKSPVLSLEEVIFKTTREDV